MCVAFCSLLLHFASMLVPRAILDAGVAFRALFFELFSHTFASSLLRVLQRFRKLSSGLSWLFGLSFWSLFGAMFLQFGVEFLFNCLVAFCNVSNALLGAVVAFRALVLEPFWNHFLQFGVNFLFDCLIAFCNVSNALLGAVVAFRALLLERFWSKFL